MSKHRIEARQAREQSRIEVRCGCFNGRVNRDGSDLARECPVCWGEQRYTLTLSDLVHELADLDAS